jgi:hypothetical protein
VKQSDLGEYEENAIEKQKKCMIEYIQDKSQAPLKTSHTDDKHQFLNSRGQ